MFRTVNNLRQIQVASHNCAGFPFRTRKRKRPEEEVFPVRLKRKPVTLIVGIICKDGIVVASDSQSTDEYGFARVDAKKLFKIDFENGESGLIGTAASVDFS